jgi:hypothetical protein
MAFTIETVTAFISVAHDGEEGVLGATIGNTIVPLICADPERVKSMFPIAQRISRETGIPYRVIQLSVRTDITDEINKQYNSSSKMTAS